jgi:hypothetical protein
LRRHENLLKRLLIHVAAFNITLVQQKILGAGEFRELKSRAGNFFCALLSGSTAAKPTEWRSRI